MPVHVASDRDALADHASSLICRLLSEAAGPRTNLGLAGGSTPEATYHRLKHSQIRWDDVDLWLSDERWVAPDDERSNGLLAERALGPEITRRLSRPRWSPHVAVEDSAAFYEASLRDMMPSGRPDVVLLGMGDDGHTASLFPDTKALEEDRRWFVANEVPQLKTWRLTATSPFLQRAADLVILVAGESKAEVLRDVLEGPLEVFPIQLVHEAEGRVWWLLDRTAASLLEKTSFEVV